MCAYVDACAVWACMSVNVLFVNLYACARAAGGAEGVSGAGGRAPESSPGDVSARRVFGRNHQRISSLGSRRCRLSRFGTTTNCCLCVLIV